MTPDQPVEGKCKECLHAIAFHHGAGCTVTSWGHRCTCEVETFASPSVPVESREQPRDRVDFYYDRLMEAARMLAERDATIRELRDRVEVLVRISNVNGDWNLKFLHVQAQRDEALAERDRARDLAAHLEEDSERLREQLEAVRALAADPCLGMGCTANCREHIDAADVLAILEEK